VGVGVYVCVSTSIPNPTTTHRYVYTQCLSHTHAHTHTHTHTQISERDTVLHTLETALASQSRDFLQQHMEAQDDVRESDDGGGWRGRGMGVWGRWKKKRRKALQTDVEMLQKLFSVSNATDAEVRVFICI